MAGTEATGGMMAVDALVDPDPAVIFAEWLGRFGQALTRRDAEGVAAPFLDEGYWKDLLALTWEHRIFAGSQEISGALRRAAPQMAPGNLRVSPSRPAPIARRRSTRAVIEGYFDFDTAVGLCTAFARLVITPEGPRAWLVLTTLQELHGFPEKFGAHRPQGHGSPGENGGRNWLDAAQERRRFSERDPEVIVIGAGQAGLSAAARLRQLGVDALVVEKKARVGDGWRERYHSLTLHNGIAANDLPYMPFPKTWPVWLSKDQLALWLEVYAECMELNVWTSTELVAALYCAENRRWTVDLRGVDGSVLQKTCRHIVVASGISGSIPNRPQLPGIAEFGGTVIHSSEYRDSAAYAGKNVLVVGTGSSGHDIAQDLVANGASSVTMMQRGPTCVISKEPGAAMIYAIYDGVQEVDDIDFVAAAVPYPLLLDSYRWITRKAAELDADLLSALNAQGMKTYFGSDGTGFQMMFMRGQGGYYIDVGCSALIADGTIGIFQAEDLKGFSTNAVEANDGSSISCDVVVLATGFLNMQENIRALFGDAVAEKVGKIWGFDEDFQMRAMWRRTGQDGLWITGGALLDSRIFSKFMALEIKADLEGILPTRDCLPLHAAA
jgi:hypothetical protein